MIDGVLDLLLMILVLGVVIVVVFTAIMPLTDAEQMGYNQVYQDKSVLENTVADPNDSYDTKVPTRVNYSFEELMLFFAVQDDRMMNPKSISVRNLVKSYDLMNANYRNTDLNTLSLGTDGVLTAVAYYGENALDTVYGEPNTQPNLGNFEITPSYGYVVNDIITVMSRSTLRLGNNYDLRVPNDAKPYYINYLYALPTTGNYKTEDDRLYEKVATYAVQIKSSTEDTYQKELDFRAAIQSYFIK